MSSNIDVDWLFAPNYIIKLIRNELRGSKNIDVTSETFDKIKVNIF